MKEEKITISELQAKNETPKHPAVSVLVFPLFTYEDNSSIVTV